MIRHIRWTKSTLVAMKVKIVATPKINKATGRDKTKFLHQGFQPRYTLSFYTT